MVLFGIYNTYKKNNQIGIQFFTSCDLLAKFGEVSCIHVVGVKMGKRWRKNNNIKRKTSKSAPCEALFDPKHRFAEAPTRINALKVAASGVLSQTLGTALGCIKYL